MLHVSTSCLNTGLNSTSHCHPETIPNTWHAAYYLKTCSNSVLEFPHHPLQMNMPTILNGLTIRNRMGMEARQVVHPSISTNQRSSENEMRGSGTMNEVGS
jgi:hypothetical protein